MTHSDSTKTLWGAIYNVQSKIAHVRTDSRNPHFNSTFASLEAVLDALKPLWIAEGLSATQELVLVDLRTTVKTTVFHHSSETMAVFYHTADNPKHDLNGCGGSFTYGRRMALKGIFGLAEVDDDGAYGSGLDKKVQAKKEASKTDSQASADPGDYIIPFGKFKDQTVRDADAHKLKDWVTWIRSQAESKKQPLSGAWLKTVTTVEAFFEQEAKKGKS